MAVTQVVKGKRKCIPTPHHKTQYKSAYSHASWKARYEQYLTYVLAEVGYESVQEAPPEPSKGEHETSSHFHHPTMGNLTIIFDHLHRSLVVQLGGLESDSLQTYRRWRGWDKPLSNNNACVGNWLLDTLREFWVKRNVNVSTLSKGDIISFRNNGSKGSGQVTKATVIGRGGAWGRNYFRVTLLEDRGVKKITPAGTEMEVHKDCIIWVESPATT